MLEQVGRGLMVLSVVVFLIGGGMFLAGRFGLPLGRLPGDIHVEGKNFTFSFPIVTSIIASIVLTIVVNVVLRLLNK